MNLRRLSFVNCKGGVGKTTLTVNIGAALVKYLKRRVLIVDLDSQANASIWLMGLARWTRLEESPTKTVCAFFKDGLLSDAIVASVLEDKHKLPLLPGLDLLPASYDLMALDDFEEPFRQLPFYQMFWHQMRTVCEEGRYDYVLFDCPPSLGRSTQCGIYSSSEIYVPCMPDLLSNVGLRLLQQKNGEFAEASRQNHLKVKEQGHRVAKLRGVILNGCSEAINASVALHGLLERVNDLRSKPHVSSSFQILPAQVRNTVTNDRAVEKALPVVLSAPNSGLAEDFERLVVWIDQH